MDVIERLTLHFVQRFRSASSVGAACPALAEHAVHRFEPVEYGASHQPLGVERSKRSEVADPLARPWELTC